jgi:hypothetical protein
MLCAETATLAHERICLPSAPTGRSASATNQASALPAAGECFATVAAAASTAWWGPHGDRRVVRSAQPAAADERPAAHPAALPRRTIGRSEPEVDILPPIAIGAPEAGQPASRRSPWGFVGRAHFTSGPAPIGIPRTAAIRRSSDRIASSPAEAGACSLGDARRSPARQRTGACSSPASVGSTRSCASSPLQKLDANRESAPPA